MNVTPVPIVSTTPLVSVTTTADPPVFGELPMVVFTSTVILWLIVTVSPEPGTPDWFHVVVPEADQLPLALEVNAAMVILMTRRRLAARMVPTDGWKCRCSRSPG